VHHGEFMSGEFTAQRSCRIQVVYVTDLGSISGTLITGFLVQGARVDYSVQIVPPSMWESAST
jgi:hypothetical protein